MMHRTLLAWLLLVTCALAEDTIELLSGGKLTGQIVERTDKEVTFRSQLNGQAITRKFPTARIHALTVSGKREELTPLAGNSVAKPTPSAPVKSESTLNTRTEQQVLALMTQSGQTPPPWFNDTPLNYPASLDLSYPDRPSGGWNNQTNVGAYLWDIINPNPSRWPSGMKLLTHLLQVNQGKPATVEKIQLQMARMYFSHLQDYARAAFWFRTAGAENTDEFGESSVLLAECYYHLGNRDMAAALLRRVSDRNSTVKAWGTLGDVDQAIAIAERLLVDDLDDHTLLYAGDACRIAGRLPEAIAYYERVLKLPQDDKNKRRMRNRVRAQENIDAIKLFELADINKVPDGTYSAQSLGYEGQVGVEVSVRSHKLIDVRVVKHNEKQFYSSIVDTPRRIIAKQSVKGIDSTSNATITSEAIINATAKALGTAAK